MEKRQIGNYAESIVTILLGIAIMLMIPYQIELPAGMPKQVVNPQLFPRLMASVIILAGVAHLLSLIIKKPDDDENRGKFHMGKLLIGIVALFAYVLLMPFLGFIIASILVVLVYIYTIARPKWYKGLAVAVISTLLIWAVFYQFLHVPLPVGFLGN